MLRLHILLQENGVLKVSTNSLKGVGWGLLNWTLFSLFFLNCNLCPTVFRFWSNISSSLSCKQESKTFRIVGQSWNSHKMHNHLKHLHRLKKKCLSQVLLYKCCISHVYTSFQQSFLLSEGMRTMCWKKNGGMRTRKKSDLTKWSWLCFKYTGED